MGIGVTCYIYQSFVRLFLTAPHSPHHIALQGLNLLFYTLERAKTMLPKGQTQFAVLADCSGFGPSKTPPLPMLKTAFITMQRHYPMRLGYVMIANAGGPIAFVWKVCE